MVPRVWVGCRVFLTDAGLNGIHPNVRDKFRGTLIVAKIEGDTISLLTADGKHGVRTQKRNLMYCR